MCVCVAVKYLKALKKNSRPATFRVTTRLDLVSPDLFAQPTAHVAHEADVVQREQREDLVRVRMKVRVDA